MAKYDEVFIKRIREIYENTDISLNQLAKREGIGKATIVKWSQDFNWIKKNKTDRPPTDQIKNRPTEPTEKKDTDKPEKISLVTEVIEPALESEEVNSGYKVFTEKEKEFIRYYFLYRFNIKAATLKAGYRSEVQGSRLLRKPKIIRAINLIRLAILERDNLNITPEYLIEELHTNLLKASGELPQVKTFVIDKFDKETTPVTVRTFEGKLRDGTIVEGTEIYGELEKGGFKDVVKNKVNERSYQVPEEFMIKDTDLKSANMTAKLIADLYGYTDSSKLARERFEHDKASKISDSKQENEVIDILKEAFGKDDG